MKSALVWILVASVSAILAAMIVAQRLKTAHSAELATQQAAWQQEKADLQAALERAKGTERVVMIPNPAAPESAPVISAKATPADIVARLRALRLAPNRARASRQVIHDFEELIAAGPAALPAIRECLARNEDVDYDSYSGGRVPDEFVLPASLRFGMFDAARRIGGEEAEKILAEVLANTGRGVELLWLVRALQESAPNKYREVALNVAHGLLGRTAVANPASPLDRYDRDNLFNVLAMFGDTTYVSTAQAQLVQPDGAVDRSALKYLQQSIGQQAVTIAAQLWNDPRLTDPAKKEPLARVALNFVGADALANEFYQKAINDLSLPNEHRKNLIEDLNQDGFASAKNLTARDLPLVENRMRLVEQLAPAATDPVNAAAFKEAYKDLVKMRQRILQPAAPAQ